MKAPHGDDMRGRLLSCFVALVFAGCSTWSRAPLDDLAAKGPEVGEQVRITLRDGRQMEWRRVRIERDSLIGAAGETGERSAVAVAEVRRVEVRSFSWGRTGGLTLGVIVVMSAAVLVALIAALVSASG